MRFQIYRAIQATLRKLIDWLMTFWLWANRGQQRNNQEHNNDSK